MRLGGNGLQDWLIQRLTAIVMAGYTLFLLFFLLTGPALEYAEWRALFNLPAMKIATILTVACIAWHAWIGLWTISTDYIKCNVVRIAFQWAVLAALAIYIVWGAMILWSNI